MIIYVNGTIGSGKTSLAVAFLYSFFDNKVYDSLSFFVKKFFPRIDGVKKDKLKIYTNISGFKFDDFEGKAEFLNFDILSKCSEIHYEIHITNKSHKSIDKAINSFFDQCAKGVEFDDLDTDLELKRVKRSYNYIKGFQFNHIILLIDEVADFFTVDDIHLIKWFNYSRHLYQDMILIQNDLSTIDKSFKNDNVVSYYIKAAEAENRLHPQLFKYAFFRKWTQPSTEKAPIKMFWLPSWIFDKYDSGQAEKSFPRIILYLIPFLILLVFFVTQLYGLISSDEEENINDVVIKERNVTIQDKQNVILYQNKSVIDRDKKNMVCFKCRSDVCFYKKDIFSYSRLEAYINIYNFDFVYKDVYSNFSNYCFYVDNSFIELYETESTKESVKNRFLSVGDEANRFSASPEK